MHADRFEESFARSGHRWTAESVGLNEQIALDKRALIKSRKGLEGVSPVLRGFFDHVAALGFADRPDYSALCVLLRRMKSSTAAAGGGQARDCHRLARKDQDRRIGKAGAAVEPDTCKFPFRGGGGDGQHSSSHARHIPVA
ncbi:hypothetical protein QFC21_002198 [Naganishia friedmannii]|uniref:Uncharacterized protein n=1 Tax=Naganishia friedmannii TaxID=89922 RepID=A0ACC2VX39_9TREE|nr:hypothetical protein QFC21_002198 [Naganishia friedmannii]